jgi:crossover junction endodeoxyribonuclease RuvC
VTERVVRRRRRTTPEPANTPRRRRLPTVPAEDSDPPEGTTPRGRPDTMSNLNDHNKKLFGYTYYDGRALDGPRPEVPTYVGIDQSSTGFGLAVLTGDGRYFLWCLQPKQVVHQDNRAGATDRYVEIRRWLRDLLGQVKLRSGPIEHVVMEGYAWGAKQGLPYSGELSGLVRMELFDTLYQIGSDRRHVKYPTIVTPQQVKKYTTGENSAPKDMMLKAVYKRWGIDVNDDNMADAYAMAEMARAIHQGGDLTSFQADVLAKVTPYTQCPLEKREELGI